MKTRQRDGKGNRSASGPKQREPMYERGLSVTPREVRTPENRYAIGERLGGGGTVVVYKGTRMSEDESGTSETPVAIKMLKRAEFSSDHENDMSRRIFVRQATNMVKVRHPNVMRALDFGYHDGEPFLVMEYFPGEDLNRLMTENKTLPWEWLGPVMLQVCDGLHAIHGWQIMHRNLTLPNIMVTMKDGEGSLRPVKEVKVLGFGISKHVYHQGTPEELTGQWQVAGVFAYMAPEQVSKGQDFDILLDHRVDIYSAGVLMYKALTGSYPFPEEELVESLVRRLNEMPPPPSSLNPNITPEVEAVILKAMATKPEDRYQTATELRAAIADTL